MSWGDGVKGVEKLSFCGLPKLAVQPILSSIMLQIRWIP